METLNQFNEQMKNLNEISCKINEEVRKEIYSQAPFIVSQRFSSEFAIVCRDNVGKKLDEVPEAMDILRALTLLEKYF